MALNKDDLSTAMIDGVKAHPDGGAEAIQALGKAIEDYLCENTDCSYSWVGVNPSGSPDPITSFKAELKPSGAAFSCTPVDFNSFIVALALFLNGVIIQAPSGFSLPPLGSKAGIFTAEQAGELDDPEDGEKALKQAYSKIADGIIKGWKSYFLPASAGSHSAFTGSAALISVS